MRRLAPLCLFALLFTWPLGCEKAERGSLQVKQDKNTSSPDGSDAEVPTVTPKGNDADNGEVVDGDGKPDTGTQTAAVTPSDMDVKPDADVSPVPAVSTETAAAESAERIAALLEKHRIDWSDPDAFFVAMQVGFVEGDAGLMWQTLPESYRGQVEALARKVPSIAGRERYDRVAKLVAKFAKVADKQREFIKNHPQVKDMLGNPPPGVDADALLDAVLDMAEIAADSQLMSAAGVEALDVNVFAYRTINPILEIVKQTPPMAQGWQEMQREATSAEFVVESQADDTAVVSVLQPDREREMKEEMTLVGDRWIISGLEQEWGEMMRGVTTLMLTRDESGIVAQAVDLFVPVFEESLDALDKAKTQDEFNGAVILASGRVIGTGIAFQQMMEAKFRQQAQAEPEEQATPFPVSSAFARLGNPPPARTRYNNIGYGYGYGYDGPEGLLFDLRQLRYARPLVPFGFGMGGGRDYTDRAVFEPAYTEKAEGELIEEDWIEAAPEPEGFDDGDFGGEFDGEMKDKNFDEGDFDGEGLEKLELEDEGTDVEIFRPRPDDEGLPKRKPEPNSEPDVIDLQDDAGDSAAEEETGTETDE